MDFFKTWYLRQMYVCQDKDKNIEKIGEAKVYMGEYYPRTSSVEYENTKLLIELHKTFHRCIVNSRVYAKVRKNKYLSYVDDE